MFICRSWDYSASCKRVHASRILSLIGIQTTIVQRRLASRDGCDPGLASGLQAIALPHVVLLHTDTALSLHVLVQCLDWEVQ